MDESVKISPRKRRRIYLAGIVITILLMLVTNDINARLALGGLLFALIGFLISSLVDAVSEQAKTEALIDLHQQLSKRRRESAPPVEHE